MSAPIPSVNCDIAENIAPSERRSTRQRQILTNQRLPVSAPLSDGKINQKSAATARSATARLHAIVINGVKLSLKTFFTESNIVTAAYEYSVW
jgi:hypothetical protein